MVPLTPECRYELNFWLVYLLENNGMPILTPIAAGIITYSEAEGTGCATIFTPHPHQDLIVYRHVFSTAESLASVTYREMLCMYQGLDRAKEALTDQSVRWLTDSANICSVVRRGSVVPYLLQSAIHIFDLTRKHRINLAMTWVNRGSIGDTGAPSKVIDYDDWGVDDRWFRHICSKLGTADFDRFADQNNAKTYLYNSRFYTPTTAGIDAFTQNWKGYLNWVVPPIHLIGRALKYMEILQCECILVAPLWYSAYFWPLLQEIITQKAQIVKGHLILYPLQEPDLPFWLETVERPGHCHQVGLQ